MANEFKCPKCGSPCDSLGTMLLVCKDPKLRQQMPIGLPVSLPPGQSEAPFQMYRCTKCGHVEMHDPSYDIPEPLG